MTPTSIKKQKGFTLLETLVAIAVMTITAGAAFSMAQKSLVSSYASKNQTVAYFLATEGLELVRTVRDNVALYNADPLHGTIGWMDPLFPHCKNAHGCDIDPASTQLYIDSSRGVIMDPTAIVTCGPNGCPLYFQSVGVPSNPQVVYSPRSTGGGAPTLFTRTIHIVENSPADGTGKKEAVVTATVTWFNNSQVVSVTETLDNWR